MRGVNQPVQMVLASTSKFFIEGIQRNLQGEHDIEVAGEASSFEEIRECLDRIKPEFLFLDNRTIKPELNELINLLSNQNLYTTLILFNEYAEFTPLLPNIIFITKETDSAKLIETIRSNNSSKGLQTQETKYTNATKYRLTDREVRIANLITSGLTNKEIASELSIAEKTVKAHLSNIFAKLEIQNRYQLMVYVRRSILNNFSEHKFSAAS